MIMKILKLISTQKSILWFLFPLLILGITFMACEDADFIAKVGCQDISPTVEGEYIECQDCDSTLTSAIDRLRVKIFASNPTLPHSTHEKYDNYDDVAVLNLLYPQPKNTSIELSVMGIGRNAERLKLKARGFNDINGSLTQTGTDEKELSVPDFKEYCQISFRYEGNTGSYDEILYEIEIDNGEDKIVRMKIRVIVSD